MAPRLTDWLLIKVDVAVATEEPTESVEHVQEGGRPWFGELLARMLPHRLPAP